MAESKLKIDVRRNAILDLLRVEGKASIAKLGETLGVTPVTIRNDLDALEREGYLVRTRGWAVLSQQLQRPMHIEKKEAFFLEKKALAAKVAELVHDGETLFLNCGTTTLYIAQALQEKKYLKIVTNSLPVAMELGNTPTFSVILLGGEVNTRFGFTYGGDTQEQLSKYKAEWAILSVDGVSTDGGITTYHSEECIIDRLMFTNSRRCLVAATASKIGKDSFSCICECSNQVTLVADKQSDTDTIAQLEQQGVKVYLV